MKTNFKLVLLLLTVIFEYILFFNEDLLSVSVLRYSLAIHPILAVWFMCTAIYWKQIEHPVAGILTILIPIGSLLLTIQSVISFNPLGYSWMVSIVIASIIVVIFNIIIQSFDSQRSHASDQ